MNMRFRHITVMSVLLLACLAFAGVSLAQAQSAHVVFGTVTVHWTDAIPAAEMRRVEIVSTSAFSGTPGETAFSNAMRRVLIALESEGYRQARLSPGDFNANASSLQFTLTIVPGPRARVVDYGFANLSHTDTLWLKKIVNQPVNVPLTADWLRAANARIARLASVRVTSDPEIITVDQNPDGTETAVAVRWALEEDRNARLDGVLAAGGEGEQSGVTGRAAMQFDGLFGRDRSIAVRYNRPRPQWNALNLRFNERGGFGSPLDWGLELDASNQLDRRQRIATRVSLSLGHRADWSLGTAAAWQRVTPITTNADPSRNIDASLGIEKLSYPSAHQTRSTISGGLWSTLSHRQKYSGPNTNSADRLRFDAHASITHVLGNCWDLSLAAMTRAWLSGSDDLSYGDEWYLGGPDHLRGYDDQAFAASSGVWGTAELGYWLVPTLGITVFGEAAQFEEIDFAETQAGTQRPVDYGAALRLISSGRVGRLEFAWRRDAALRDGYVRLKVTQSW